MATPTSSQILESNYRQTFTKSEDLYKLALNQFPNAVLMMEDL